METGMGCQYTVCVYVVISYLMYTMVPRDFADICTQSMRAACLRAKHVYISKPDTVVTRGVSDR